MGVVGISVFIAVIAFYIFSLHHIIVGNSDPVLEVYACIISILIAIVIVFFVLSKLFRKSWLGKQSRKLVGFTADCARY